MELWLVLFMSEGQDLEKKVHLLAVSKVKLFDQKGRIRHKITLLFFPFCFVLFCYKF